MSTGPLLGWAQVATDDGRLVEPEADEEPRFLHERVEITLEGEVVRGHLRVALALVEARLNDSPVVISLLMGEWISENRARDDAAGTWRRRWWSDLVAHPAVAAAFHEDGVAPDELFARAGLSISEEMCMRKALQTTDDGQPLSQRAIATALGMPESTVRSKLERAKAALHLLAAPRQPLSLTA